MKVDVELGSLSQEGRSVPGWVQAGSPPPPGAELTAVTSDDFTGRQGHRWCTLRVTKRNTCMSFLCNYGRQIFLLQTGSGRSEALRLWQSECGVFVAFLIAAS